MITRCLSSYGHVRDLPEKDGSVLPDEDFRMIYEPLADKKQRIADIAKAIKDARHLYLATDPDREGEAISWHLLSALKEQNAIKDVDVKRVVFPRNHQECRARSDAAIPVNWMKV